MSQLEFLDIENYVQIKVKEAKQSSVLCYSSVQLEFLLAGWGKRNKKSPALLPSPILCLRREEGISNLSLVNKAAWWVYVYMYVMHTCVHYVCAPVDGCICVYAYTQMCFCAHVCACVMYAYMHLCTCVPVYVQACEGLCGCVCCIEYKCVLIHSCVCSYWCLFVHICTDMNIWALCAFVCLCTLLHMHGICTCQHVCIC